MPAESALSLVERLRAALDRAEEIARAAHEMIEGEPWWEEQALTSDGTMHRVDAEFIATNDPSSVLRTVAAHRKLIDLAEEASSLDAQVDLNVRVGARDEAEEPYLGDLILREMASIYFPEGTE